MRQALSSPLALRLRGYALPLVVLIAVWFYISATTDTFRGESAFFSVLEGFPLMGLVVWPFVGRAADHAARAPRLRLSAGAQTRLPHLRR